MDPDLASDCHASGAAAIGGAAFKGTRIIMLCTHCIGRHRPRLEHEHWIVDLRDPSTDDCDTEIAHT